MPLAIKSEDWLARFDQIDRAYMGATVVLGLIAAGDVGGALATHDRSAGDGASGG